MNCFFYKKLDWFKQTWLASELFYYGKRFQRFGEIKVVGRVAACQHPGLDGDATFDLIESVSGRLWHCEVTVCASEALRKAVTSLRIADEVSVQGRRTYDPDHHLLWKKYQGGHDEIHPVVSICGGTVLAPRDLAEAATSRGKAATNG